MKYFKVCTSKNNDIVIDEEDLSKLLAGLNTGSFVQLKKAIINPSFVVSVVSVKASEALKDEKQSKIEGHVDEKTGKFVVTKDERTPVEIKSEFDGMKSIKQITGK